MMIDWLLIDWLLLALATLITVVALVGAIVF